MSTIVETLGEKLSRRINRRSALEKAAKVSFAALAGVAVGGLSNGKRAEAYTCSQYSSSCACSPPGGRYCAFDKCSGENCTGGCSFYYGYWPSTACWCTQNCFNYNHAYRGYYKCCDCNCSGTTCACAKFVYTCGPCGPACC